MGKAFDKYRASISESRDNPAKFNEGIYEELTFTGKNNKGEVVPIKQMAFVQKYRMSDYYAAERTAWKGPALSENPTRAELKAKADFDANRKAIMQEWYSKNATEKKVNEEIDKIIAEKQHLKDSGVLTDKEYEDWLKLFYILKRMVQKFT